VGWQESTYESSTHPVHNSIGQTSLTTAPVVDIEPMNFRQVFQKKQQLISVRPACSTFQQTSGIRNVANANFTGRYRRRRKEVYQIVVPIKIRIWVKDKAFNGLLALVNDQRSRIEVSGAIRIKEEVTHPIWNVVAQDIFVFHLSMDTNQIWVFIYKSPQALSIRGGITDVSYLPEGYVPVCFYPKCKAHWYRVWISNNVPETFVEEITRFSKILVEVEWITFPGQVEKIVPLNKLWRHC